MEKIFFQNWESIIRTAVITLLAYCYLVFLLRTSGKRTLSKMNAFDFIVTIAIGSTLATVILNKNVALAEGLLAFTLLVLLQLVITWISARSQSFSHLVKSTPSLLVYKGEMLKGMMKKERIDEDEVHAIIREKGFSRLKDIAAVVLETDGSLTVIANASLQDESLQNVRHPFDQNNK